MPTRRRTNLALEAERRNREQLTRLGGDARSTRLAMRITQDQLGGRVGLSQSAVSRAELGQGGGLTLDAWQRIGIALGRPLIVGLQRDVTGQTADAGHLAMQELMLRLGRGAGYRGRFELAMKPSEPWRSTDVGLIDDVRGRLLLVECWNTIGDIGAASRSTDRKRAEAEQFGFARWGEEPFTVASVWVVRASARNRAIVARYPEVFGARFPGSSRRWVDALTRGTSPPIEPGLVWADLDATKISAWRRRR